MILKRLKLMLLSALGVPLMLLIPFVKRSMRKLEEQYENNPESLPEEIRESMYFTRLTDQAHEALMKGEYETATQLAKEQIKLAEKFKNNWNYGNAIHHGNTVLGLVAMKEGEIERAERHLIKAGNTAGSPQLDTKGPCFSLAMELIAEGRTETVLQYLSSVEEFWEYGYKYLPAWKEAARSQEIPEGWKRLEY